MRTPPTTFAVDVETLGGNSRMPVKDGKQHVEPPLIEPHRQPPRRAGRLVDQRLNLDQQRPGAFPHHRHHAARDIGGPAREEDRRGVPDLSQPFLRHREETDLVRGAEAVLDGPDDAEPAIRLALEVQHRVHHVLQNPGTRDRAVLGDVPDQQHRDGAGPLRGARVGPRSRAPARRCPGRTARPR